MPKRKGITNDSYLDSKYIVHNKSKLSALIEEVVNKLNNFKTFENFGGMTLDEFKDYLISDNVAGGIHFFHLSINGGVSCAIVQKASNNFLSFIQFSYAIKAIQYTYAYGNWTQLDL